MSRFQLKQIPLPISILIYIDYSRDDFVSNAESIKSVLDYRIEIRELALNDRFFLAIPGKTSVGKFFLN